MNKTAIKTFAIWARNKLIADISYKAGLLGITDKEIKSALPQSTNDAQFFDIGTQEPYQITGAAIAQRRQLADKISEKAKQSDYATAYKAVIEEVAYTWFNRLIAVRFMEVNDYLPSRVRVLSSQLSVVSGTAKAEPDIVTRPFDTDLEFTAAERDYIIACKNDNKLDELFRMLFIKQCNALNVLLPELFERTDDYTELLLNISFTDKDGVLWHLINDITEDDFKEAVEIIGWLYQYYNTEPKDETFALLKKNVKITKERIPAATQLFTPRWIVRYMVENSLGRIFMSSHVSNAQNGHLISSDNIDEKARIEKEKEIADKMGWKYYLPEAEQTPEVRTQLITENLKLKTEWNVEDITFLDPCMGSGHILVYAFEVFMQIYESAGYSQRDAARLILEKNIHGLDIDKRAYQLAYFALFMKARQYNRRILDGSVAPQVYHPAGWVDGEEFGSLITADSVLRSVTSNKLERFLADGVTYNPAYEDELRVWNFKRLLSQKYDIVCTNPPYMGGSGMSGRLAQFLKDNYTDSKSDLFAAFIERSGAFLITQGFNAMITQHAWMFLSSYEKLRVKLQQRDTVNMAHLGARAFAEIGGEVVQCTAFVMRDRHFPDYKGIYVRLVDINDADEKEVAFLSGNHRHAASADNFAKIPGSPVAYWVSEAMLRAFEVGRLLDILANPKKGLATTDNNRFLRFWFEVSQLTVGIGFTHKEAALASKMKWFPLNKGGEFRRWYGNIYYLVNWGNDGAEMKAAIIKRYNGGSYTKEIRSEDKYFRNSITWSALTSSVTGFRFSDYGALFDSAGSSLFPSEHRTNYILGLLNSKVIMLILSFLNPTLNYGAGTVRSLPIVIDEQIKPKADSLVTESISLSRADWDSFETSWDFKRHPLV